MELEVRAPRHAADEAIFWLGGPIVPGGYGWAFPCGEGRVRVGVGVVRPDADAEPRVLLDRLLAEFPAADATAGIELHSGLMPVIAPRAATLVADGMVVVGDAAGQGSTLLGEGIRYAIAAGQTAGEVIAAAADRDFTAGSLAAYPREWHRRAGRDLRISYAVNQRICSYGDDDWDRAIRRLDRLSAKQAANVFASDFSLRWAAGVLWRDPGLVRSVARGLRSGGRASSSRRAPSP
jgi:digeranylgeranylglycerophospholipid reductase